MTVDKFSDKLINMLEFAVKEESKFRLSLADYEKDFDAINAIQNLYEAALIWPDVDENEIILFQLLSLTHYHFLFSTVCLMRCHLSESYASVRVAIDAALIAITIIHDRPSQIEYATRKAPFHQITRHYKNMMQAGKELPSDLIPHLIKLFNDFSGFASHADIHSFLHRFDVIDKTADTNILNISYFQYSRNKDERDIHLYNILHTFIIILDTFSNFLFKEQKVVNENWLSDLHHIGAVIERRVDELRKLLPENFHGELA